MVSVFVGGIGGYYLWNVRWWIGAAAWIIVVYMFAVVNVKYCKRLVALYRCIEEEENEIKVEYLEKTFEKAWMLHCYLDDVMEDEDSAEFDKSFS